MTKRWIAVPMLCISLLLLASAVSAADPADTADSRTTLRASTSAAGSSLVQAANDAPPGEAHPSWIGLFVLFFGGLLAGLWVVAGMLSVVRAIGDTGESGLTDFSLIRTRGRQEESLSDWS